MASYPINKGVGKSVEVKGLRAGYVIFAVVGTVLALLLLFLLLLLVPIAIAIVVGVSMLLAVWWASFYLNKKYGEYGLMQRRAASNIPMRIGISYPITKLLRHEKSIW